MKNLVIVESPAKAKTLEKFLGKEYKVMSSYGHIRDLKKNDLSIEDGYDPEYEIPSDKKKVVAELKKASSVAETIWLASDEDREGEAISWHLAQVLGLDMESTKRIVFHEITKNAILEAIENPRNIDINLVNAQQARRVLDRLVGFKLSPVLWRKLKPSLSAGRVQSVSVRLIVDREKEIEAFQAESSYKVVAVFNEGENEFKADFNKRFKTDEEAREFLQTLTGKTFRITEIAKKPMNRVPAPPFTTSTLQQEASRKLGFTVSQTMMIAQHLYESGLITYMRTDSVNLSTLCLSTSKAEVISMFGETYSKPRNYHTSSKGAQEAHEAIRPTYASNHEIKGNAQEKKLYDLIWKRTLASQMADAEIEKTTVTIEADGIDDQFTATGEVVKFDGFFRVYKESNDEEFEGDDEIMTVLPPLQEGQVLTSNEIVATQHFTQAPFRYTEASLVRKLEELGIGRPSTYAPIISTIQQREYVEKGNKAGEKRSYTILTLADGKVSKTSKSELIGNDKGKLLPTDIGIVVNDFLLKYFPEIMDYNFTANVEKEFDDIAEGKKEWHAMIRDFDKDFSPLIDNTIKDKTEHKVGERFLGNDPKTGKPVSVKIGRFGPVGQIGSASDEDKPQFAQLKKGQSIQSITFEEAMELFSLPRTLGKYKEKPVTIGAGRFGPYILYDGKYTSLPKDYDPMKVGLAAAIQLIDQHREAEAKKLLQTFTEDAELQVLNGRWGAYISYKGTNYKIPKKYRDAGELSYATCMEIVNG